MDHSQDFAVIAQALLRLDTHGFGHLPNEIRGALMRMAAPSPAPAPAAPEPTPAAAPVPPS